jgi:hypothetical protein
MEHAQAHELLLQTSMGFSCNITHGYWVFIALIVFVALSPPIFVEKFPTLTRFSEPDLLIIAVHLTFLRIYWNQLKREPSFSQPQNHKISIPYLYHHSRNSGPQSRTGKKDLLIGMYPRLNTPPICS